MKRSEKCGCGASLSITLPSDLSDYAGWFSTLEKRFASWRTEHRHEVEPHAGEPDHIAAGPGGSDNQIAYDDHDYHRPRIGFSPNGI